MALMDNGTDGERVRFERLFRDNSRAVLGYALRRTDTPEDAADVLSEVMAIAWRRRGEMPVGSAEKAWLLGVARKVLANQRRSTSRRQGLGMRLRNELAAAAQQTSSEEETADEVRLALRRLPRDDQEILLLNAWEGFAPSELAEVLAITPEAARTRLHRSRARLRAALEADDADATKKEEIQ